jgi:6-pyruvoyl-tetrahydropterin synthase
MPVAEVKHVLEWKELSQTIMALNLSIAQIDLSMTEGSYSIDTLIDTFNFMREGLDRLNHSVLNDEIQDVAELKLRLLQESQVLSEKVTASIVAFQFYDKLSQRLQHVSKSLSSLSDIISHEERTVDEAKWNSFLEKMAKYATMREEYELYELIFTQGLSGEQAIEVMKDRMRARMEERKNQPAPEDDIELF